MNSKRFLWELSQTFLALSMTSLSELEIDRFISKVNPNKARSSSFIVVVRLPSPSNSPPSHANSTLFTIVLTNEFKCIGFYTGSDIVAFAEVC